MGFGYLMVNTLTANETLPVGYAKIEMTAEDGSLFYTEISDANGVTKRMGFNAPDESHTFDPYDPGPYYGKVNVKVTADRYNTKIIHGVQIYDTITMILPVNLSPVLASRTEPETEEIFIPRHQLEDVHECIYATGVEPGGRILRQVVIPNYVTVHLGTPASSAQNVRVAFKTYIKNVATHEIYATWPLASLEANILAQISLLLNRIFTEWYPSKGYGFDIAKYIISPVPC